MLRPKPALLSEMTRFHSDDYVNFLRVITPDNMQEYMRQLQRCVLVLLWTPPHENPNEAPLGLWVS